MKPKSNRMDLDRLNAARSGVIQLHAFSSIRAADLEEGLDHPADSADDSESKASGPAGERRVVMSTDAVDRYGDVIDQNGWELDNFRANPVLMPAHNYGVNPVGTVSDVQVSGRALVGTLKFWLNDPSGAGLSTAQAYHDGILRGVSVGFRPLSWRPRSELAEDHPAHGARGFFIERAELLELSTAPIPVNQEALAIQRAIGATLPAAPAPELELVDQIRSILSELLATDPSARRAIQRAIDAILLSKPQPTTPADPAERIATWLSS